MIARQPIVIASDLIEAGRHPFVSLRGARVGEIARTQYEIRPGILALHEVHHCLKGIVGVQA